MRACSSQPPATRRAGKGGGPRQMCRGRWLRQTRPPQYPHPWPVAHHPPTQVACRRGRHPTTQPSRQPGDLRFAASRRITVKVRTRSSAIIGTLCLVASLALTSASADEPAAPRQAAKVTLKKVATAQNPIRRRRRSRRHGLDSRTRGHRKGPGRTRGSASPSSTYPARPPPTANAACWASRSTRSSRTSTSRSRISKAPAPWTSSP